MLATLSALLVALPGTALTVGLLALFAALGPSAIRVVEFASLGITAFILFLLAHYVTKVVRSGGQRRFFYLVIALVAYLMTGADKTIALVSDLVGTGRTVFTPELSALGLIVLAIAAIAGYSIYERVRYKSAKVAETHELPSALRRIVVAVGVLTALIGASIIAALLIPPASQNGTFLGLITLSTLSSFGGGEAYVGVADGFLGLLSV